MTDTPRRGRPFTGGSDPRRQNGKAPGTRSRATRLLAALAAGDAEAVVRAVVTRARRGDPAAARLILDRVWPAPKERTLPEGTELPQPTTPADLPAALLDLVRLAGTGALDLSEAERVAGLLGRWREATEAADLAARVERLEARMLSRGLP